MERWKKRLAYFWRRIKRIKNWQLFVIFLLLLIVAFFGLRQNNLEMIDLRNKVIEADEALNWDQVNLAANNLHKYVNNHMNTNTGQIALQNLYDRDVSKAFGSVNTDIDSSSYNKATEACQSLIAQYGYQEYAKCVADSVGISGEEIKTPTMPNSALYYISFVSPRLSFDIPGVSIILMIVVFLTFLLRTTTGVVLEVIGRKKGKL